MNGQMGELMRSWMVAALQGRNQMDVLSGWLNRGAQDAMQANSNYMLNWNPSFDLVKNQDSSHILKQLWDTAAQLQEFSIQWMQMAFTNENLNHDRKISQLERKIEEQKRTIESLRERLNSNGTDNNELISQFQKTIKQQSQQFKQLASSVGQYFNQHSVPQPAVLTGNESEQTIEPPPLKKPSRTLKKGNNK
ncbi:MAG: hypothetical protein GY874_15565 [Desulfobacteraceae bacterium]|nr:hypothetical protein [Desulfobacteraceae bacterium]